MSFKKLMAALAVLITAFFVSANPAHAEPVSTIMILQGLWAGLSYAAATAGAWLVGGSLLANLVLSAGLSMLGRALQKKPSAAQSGVKTSTSTGGSTPQTFIVGGYATAGQLITPLMSYGADGKTPNAYLTYVIAVGCRPGHQLSRLILNDDYVPVSGSLSAIGESTVQGYALGGDYAGNAWIIYHDGTQTTADALLVEKFSSYPDRPWSSNMVGYGQAYAVLVFKFNPKLWSGTPQVRFELVGAPLYDPRYDSTVGGSGTQRWANQATWAATDNPVVMIYNIHRGITLPDGSIWGGEAKAEDLPLDNWFAAMNACDVSVAQAGGGTERAYRAGLEISLSDQPADIIDTLETACCAQQVEIGGVWKIRVGGPGLPVYFFTDDDVLVDHDQNHDMFPSMDETHNGITATHPMPSALWNATDAPARYNANWEADDGGRRLIADLSLPAVYSPTQAQRLMQSAIEEERRFRRHALSFGPYASILEPLDAVAWTSAKEGYTTKVFEVSESTEGLLDINMALGLRERDAADYVWTTADELPWVAAMPGSALPVAQAVPGWAVTPTTITDATGTARRPALALTWDGAGLLDVSAVMWQVRVTATGADVASGTASNVKAGGIVIAEGLLSNISYQARGQLVTNRPTEWTAWVSATTPNVALVADNTLSVGSRAAGAVNTAIDAASAAVIVAQNTATAASTAAATEAANRIAAVAALSATLTAQISAVQAQVADLSGTEPYVSATTYQIGDFVKYTGGLYTAKAVTTGNLPTNTTYWTKVGNYASVGDAVAALAANVTTNNTQISTLNDTITAEVTDRQALSAQLRGSYTGTDPNALTTGLVYGEKSARVAADTANAASITAVSAALPGKADASALNTTNVTVASQGTTLAAAVINIASLTAALPGKADATALAATNLRVTAAEGNISTTVGTVNSLTAKLNATVPNLIYNPTFNLGLTKWTAGNWSATAAGNVEGYFAYCTSNGTNVLNADLVGVGPSQVYTPQANMTTAGITAGVLVMDVLWFNSSMGAISSPNSLTTTRGLGWTDYSYQVTSPAGAAWAQVRIYTQGATNTICGVRRVKFALATAASVWSDDATYGPALQGQATALNTTNVTVTSQGTTLAAAVANIASLTASLPGKADASALNTTNVTVASQGATLAAAVINIASLTAALPGKADATALAATNLRVTAAEGNISTTAGTVNSLTAKLNATVPNLIYNPTFNLGLTKWTAGNWSATAAGNVEGYFAYCTSNGTNVLNTDLVGVGPSQVYTPQANMTTAGLTAGDLVMDVLWFNSSMGAISSPNSLTTTRGQGWTDYSYQTTSPVGAAWAIIRIYTQGATNTVCAVRRVKFALGTAASVWSDDATYGPALLGQATALNTTNVTVASQGTTLAAAVANIASLTASLPGKADASALNTTNVTVASQGTTLAAAVTNLSTVSATVGSHTASISTLSTVSATHTSAIASIVSLTKVGTRISGYINQNNGTTSDFDILASNFSVSDGTTSVKPFAISGGITTISNVKIAVAAIDTIAVGSSFIVAAQPTVPLQSTAALFAKWNPSGGDFNNIATGWSREAVTGHGSWLTGFGSYFSRECRDNIL